MRACTDHIVVPPRCTKEGDYAVRVEYYGSECVIPAKHPLEINSIIDSLQLRILPTVRCSEDIRHRSSGLENWLRQCIQHDSSTCEPTLTTKSVQGQDIPFYVFDPPGGSRFVVWFNVWPCAWIAGGDAIYERCDNMKDVFSGIKRRCSHVSGYRVAGIMSTASMYDPAANYGVANAPPKLMPEYVIVTCYDGTRLVSKRILQLMKCGTVIPDYSCNAFDIVHDILRERVRRLKMSPEAVLFIDSYSITIPAGVGVMRKVADDTRPGAISAADVPASRTSAIEIDGVVVKIVPHREV